MDLAAIALQRVGRDFEFAGQPVHIECYPHKITPAYRIRLAALAKRGEKGQEHESEEQKEQDAAMINDLVPEWSIVMQGVPYPPTYENLLETPVTVLGRVSGEIMEVIKELSNPSGTKSKK